MQKAMFQPIKGHVSQCNLMPFTVEVIHNNKLYLMYRSHACCRKIKYYCRKAMRMTPHKTIRVKIHFGIFTLNNIYAPEYLKVQTVKISRAEPVCCQNRARR